MAQSVNPEVAVGRVSEGVVHPLVPLKDLFEAQLGALHKEHAARLWALGENQQRTDTQTVAQAATLSQTVAQSAAALEQRVNASAEAAAAVVAQTREAFEKSLDRNAEAAATSMLAVRREVELREEFNRRENLLRSDFTAQMQAFYNTSVQDRVELARSAHEAEHTRIREIGVLADQVRAAKDADANEWRRTVEGLIARAVSGDVLEAKLDALGQRIELATRNTTERAELAARSTTEREELAARELNRRISELEKRQNENAGGRSALLSLAALGLTLASIAVGVILFIISHQ